MKSPNEVKLEDETLTVELRLPWKNCENCVVFYKGEHTCADLLKLKANKEI